MQSVRCQEGYQTDFFLYENDKMGANMHRAQNRKKHSFKES